MALNFATPANQPLLFFRVGRSCLFFKADWGLAEY